MSKKRVALITGASRGLGRELARALHGRGFDLALVARGEQELRAFAEELGPEVLPIAADVPS